MDRTILEISNLTKKYKGELGQKDYLALEDLSLQINQGEVFAFLGPNGAGKSTTIKLITRLLHPTRGNVFILGKSNKTPDAMKHLGYMPEQPALYGHLTGREFLLYMAHLYGLSFKKKDTRIDTLISTVGLSHRADHAIRGYSRGMVQRLALAQALIHNPDLLILDEPMASLDPIGRKDFRDLILNLKEQGKTIFFSSHILNDAEMIADRIGILNQGHLVSINAMQELVGNEAPVEITFQTDQATVDSMGLSNKVCARQDANYMIRVNPNEAQEVLQTVANRCRIISVIPQRMTLEDVFMAKIGEGR